MAIVPSAISKVLNNGAEIFAFKQKNPDTYMLVLAKWNGEWVTWAVSPNGDAYWGHYFQTDFDKAYADWEKR